MVSMVHLLHNRGIMHSRANSLLISKPKVNKVNLQARGVYTKLANFLKNRGI